MPLVNQTFRRLLADTVAKISDLGNIACFPVQLATEINALTAGTQPLLDNATRRIYAETVFNTAHWAATAEKLAFEGGIGLQASRTAVGRNINAMLMHTRDFVIKRCLRLSATSNWLSLLHFVSKLFTGLGPGGIVLFNELA